MPYNKNCVECGEEFISRDKRGKLCGSKTCKRSATKKRNARNYRSSPPIVVTKVCVGCGKEYQTKAKNQKFHKDSCKQKYYRKQRLEYWTQYQVERRKRLLKPINKNLKYISTHTLQGELSATKLCAMINGISKGNIKMLGLGK